MHTHRWPVRSACRDAPSLHRARNGQWWRATAERSPEGSRGTKNCSLRSSSCVLRLLLPVAGEDTRALHFEARADVRPLAVPGCRRSGFLCTQSTQHKRENHAGSAAGRKAAENPAVAAASGEHGGPGFSPGPTFSTTRSVELARPKVNQVCGCNLML